MSEQDNKETAGRPSSSVKHVSGSTAGAGSGDFHQYRNARRIEQNRLHRMEQQAEEENGQQEYAERVRLQKAKEAVAAAKKKDKRMRRKKNQKNRTSVKNKEADKDMSTTNGSNEQSTPQESAPLIVTQVKNTDDIEEEELELKPFKATKTKV